MNAMRLAVGILFVVLASITCTLAMAEVAELPSEATVRQTSSATVSDSDPAPAQERSSTTSIAKSQDDDLDGCCCPSCNNPCPSVYGQVEALFMQQDPRVLHQPIVVDPNTNTTFMSTSDFNFNFDPGLRATVGMRLWENWALEFSYFGVFQGSASAVAVKPDADAFLTFPGNSFGNVFVDMNRVQANYSSRVNSFELNLPCCCGCCNECCDECACLGRRRMRLRRVPRQMWLRRGPLPIF